MPNKEYYAKHREEIITRVKQYSKENMERISYRNYLYHQMHRQKLLERERKRRREHRDEINARRRDAYAKDPITRQKHIQIHRVWYAKNRERQVLKLREAHLSLRKQVIEKLGEKCCRCGFDDLRALQIDHIQGNGNKEKQAIGIWQMHKKILELEPVQLAKEYQLLCANCNWIKKAENNEVVGFKRNY